MSRRLNISLWIIQVALAFYNLAGGAYSWFNYKIIIWPSLHAVPAGFWMLFFGLQIVSALGLILPGIFRMSHKITAVSALYLMVNGLASCALFVAYEGFPGMLWGLVPAALAAWVAYKRWS